jgi:hypothetical protein
MLFLARLVFIFVTYFDFEFDTIDRLCGLVLKSSWLQIRRPGFDSRHYQKKSSGSGTGTTQPREYN